MHLNTISSRPRLYRACRDLVDFVRLFLNSPVEDLQRVDHAEWAAGNRDHAIEKYNNFDNDKYRRDKHHYKILHQYHCNKT